MIDTDFRQFLKKSGKKPHVVDGLVTQVRQFEIYLSSKHGVGLDAAGKQHLHEYVNTLDAGEAKKQMRGLALYYQFTGNHSVAELASTLREQGIAHTRQAFKLRDFRGVDLKAVATLEAIGIVTVEHMLVAGKTRANRKQLSNQIGIAPAVILELVKLSDLSRLGAIKAVRARLYYDAGLDTPAKFTQWEPEALRHMLVEFVAYTGFEGIAPLPKELRNAIAKAKKLPLLIEY